MRPRVSVVMAAYNASAFLVEAVDAVLNQNYTDFKFIIIDDGSTDDTLAILQSYTDSRIVLLRNHRNLGLTKSLIRTLGVAVNTDYMARVDADDVAEPDLLGSQVEFLERHPNVGVVGSARHFIDSSGSIIKTWVPSLDNATIQEMMFYSNHLPHGGAMFRTDCLKEIGGYRQELLYAQDYDLALRISEQWDVANLKTPLYRIRVHDKRISNTRKKEQDQIVVQVRHEAIDRRTNYAKTKLGVGDRQLPTRLQAMDRRQLAQRFAWWSAGARAISKGVAFRWLMFALLFDPTSPDIWAYVRGIMVRKLRF